MTTNTTRIPTLQDGAVLLNLRDDGFAGHARVDGQIYALHLTRKPTNRLSVYAVSGAAVEGDTAATLSGTVFAEAGGERASSTGKPRPDLTGAIWSSTAPDQRLDIAVWNRRATSGILFFLGRLRPHVPWTGNDHLPETAAALSGPANAGSGQANDGTGHSTPPAARNATVIPPHPPIR